MSLSYRREARQTREWQTDAVRGSWKLQSFITLHILRDGVEVGTVSTRTERREWRWHGRLERGRLWRDDWAVAIPGCPAKLSGTMTRAEVLARLKPFLTGNARDETMGGRRWRAK